MDYGKALRLYFHAHQIEAMKLAPSPLLPSPTAVLANFRPKQISSSSRITIGLAVAFSFIVPAYSGMTILEQQYHCSGETYWGNPETGYSYTDSSPVSGRRIDVWDGIWSSAWKFGASADTGASSGWASASTMIVFSVDDPIFILEVVGRLYSTAFPDIWGGVSYSLSDNLTNGIIGSQSWSLSDADLDNSIGRWVRYIGGKSTPPVTYNLVTGNPYKLLISANVSNADGTYAYIDSGLIPEPSSALLATLGCLGLLRRRRN